jgi:hypothetical protein
MISHALQVQDLYTAGIGCDLGGAFLLARGLIDRPAELTRLAGSFYGHQAPIKRLHALMNNPLGSYS